MNLLQRPPVFVVGAQRSGTSWVQRLLGAHPGMVAGQESHLFSGYLAPLWQRWQLEDDLRSRGHRTVGLGCYLTEEEFTATLRQLATTVFAALDNAKPGATRFVEKTPDHARHLPLIHRLFPEAAVVHVIRDGRAVAASLRAAAQQPWGETWAPATVTDAARRWVDWVEEIRVQARTFATYQEVRYEDLVERGPETLAALFDFLEAPLPSDQIAELYERYNFAACAAGTAPESLVLAGSCRASVDREPEGFFRQGRASAWKEELTEGEIEVVQDIAGDLLEELGYPLLDLAPRQGAVSHEPVRGDARAFVSTVPRSDILWVGPGGLKTVRTGNAQLLYRERLYLYATVLALAPERCLEIGVAQGGSSRLIYDALKDLGRGRLVSVDPQPALSYDPATVADFVTFLTGPSPETLVEARERAGGLFDFVLLDGDHSEGGVYRDLEGLVAVTHPGTVILAHDAYFPPVAAALDRATQGDLPYVDGGILSRTRNDGIENGRPVSYAGLRLLVRSEASARRGSTALARRLAGAVKRRLLGVRPGLAR